MSQMIFGFWPELHSWSRPNGPAAENFLSPSSLVVRVSGSTISYAYSTFDVLFRSTVATPLFTPFLRFRPLNLHTVQR